MPEIVFSCECGMTLKVRDSDQAGAKLICPSCSTVVPIPAFARPTPPPPPAPPTEGEAEDVEDAPGDEATSGGGQGFGVLYLACASILTLAAVAFLLLPALKGPAKGAPRVTIASKLPVEAGPGKKVKADTNRPARRSTPAPRPEEVDEPAAELVEPDPAPVPRGKLARTPRSRPAPPPVVDDEEDAGPEPATPPKKSKPPARSSSPSVPPASKTAPRPPPKANTSPYAFLKNPTARKALEDALKNTVTAASASAALRFLKIAEKAAEGDPATLAEVKKLRDKVSDLRSKAP